MAVGLLQRKAYDAMSARLPWIQADFEIERTMSAGHHPMGMCLMPPPDSDEYGLPDGADDEAAE